MLHVQCTPLSSQCYMYSAQVPSCGPRAALLHSPCSLRQVSSCGPRARDHFGDIPQSVHPTGAVVVGRYEVEGCLRGVAHVYEVCNPAVYAAGGRPPHLCRASPDHLDALTPFISSPYPRIHFMPLSPLSPYPIITGMPLSAHPPYPPYPRIPLSGHLQLRAR